MDHTSAIFDDVQADEIKQILDTCATGITRCSRDLLYLSANGAYAALVGLPASQIIGRTINEVIGSEAFQVIRPYVEGVLNGERVEFEAEVPLMAGGVRFLHVVYTPWIERDGQVTGWVGSVSDITERVRAKQSLEEREQRLRMALEASGGGSWTWDAHTGRVDWDDRFRELYGFTAEEPASAEAWPSRVHEEDRPRVLAALDEVMGTTKRNSWDNTFRVVRPDGTVVWIEARGRADRDADGQIVRLTGLDMDVTERRQDEEREAFLFRLSDTLRSLSDPVALQQAAVRLLGERLDANRVHYADIDGTDFVIRHSYVNGVTPFFERGPVQTFGASLFPARRQDEPVSVNDVHSDPRLTEPERSTLLRNQVAAFAGVSLIRNKQWLGVVGVHHAKPRAWTRSELQLIQDVAERIWEAAGRARAEEALKEREQRLTLALDASAAGIWTWDVRNNQLYWDDRTYAQFGYVPGTAPPYEVWLACVHPEDRPRLLARIDQMQQTPGDDEWNMTTRILRRDGTLLWLQGIGRAERDSNRRVTRLMGIGIDITKDKQAEEALREREQMLRLALDASGAGCWMRDARTGRVVWDERYRKLYGFTAEEPASFETWLGRVYKEDHAKVFELIDKFKNTPTQDGFDSTFRIVRPDGTLSWMQSLGQAHRDAGGRIIGFTGLELDVTDRRHAEEALQIQRVAAVERTLQKQAEDALRRSHAELEQRTIQLRRLASQLTLTEQSAREHLAKTLHDGLQQLLFCAGMTLDQAVKTNSQDDQAQLLRRAHADVKEAMEAARTLSLNLFPPMLNISGLPAALRWLAKRTQEQYKVVVSVTADPHANPETSDARILFFEAVRELVFNAIKHAQVDRVDINLELWSNQTIHLQVSDKGVGFDPSVTLHHQNQHQVGLGLFSIQERLALFGGHLDIQSAPGNGAQFSLILPRTNLRHLATHGTETQHHDAVWQEQIVYESAGSSRKVLRILIADDHPVARAGLRELISSRPPLRVVGEASNGVEAISQALALQPDIIVMDVSMPQMNGIEVTRNIHSSLPQIQIIGLSTHDDENTERLMLDAGVEAYFTKNEGTDRLLTYLLSLVPHVRTLSAD